MLLTEQQIDIHNRITGYAVHDSTIVGFKYDDQEFFKVDLKRSDDSKVSISFSKIKNLGFVDFRNGAIIMDIYTWPISKIEDVLLRKQNQKDAWETLFADNFSEIELERSIQNIEKPYYLTLIDCVYGGSIACICSDISISDVN